MSHLDVLKGRLERLNKVVWSCLKVASKRRREESKRVFYLNPFQRGNDNEGVSVAEGIIQCPPSADNTSKSLVRYLQQQLILMRQIAL